MRIKTRPDLHHASLPDGVYVSAGSAEFALRGWSGFSDLMSRCLPLLGRGADEDELVAVTGTERARPAIRTLLAQLDQHGMILHLDQLRTPEPGADERERHADLLAYLECRSHEPYAAFARMLSSRVLLVGPEAALDVAERALREIGMTGDRDDQRLRRHDAAVVAMTRDRVDQIPPRTTRFVPVVVGPASALVGPLVRDLDDWDQWRALVERVVDREGAPLDEAPATTIAVSSAVHLLVQELAGVAGPKAYVVSGDTFTVEALDPMPPPTTRPVTVSLSEATEPEDPTHRDVTRWLPRALHPWLGWGVPEGEDTLPQMPVALRRVRLVDGSVLVVAGPDQEQASVEAALETVRRQHGSTAAGASERRWLLDGALRLLAGRATSSSTSGVELDEEGRRLRAGLPDSGAGVTMTSRRVPGISWCVVDCRLADGRVVSAWGPSERHAAHCALGHALATIAAGGDAGDLVVTRSLTHAGHDETAELTSEIAAWASQRALRVVGHPAPTDVVLGDVPVHAGPVTFVAAEAPGADLHEQTSAVLEQTLVAAVADAIDVPDPTVVLTRGWEPSALRTALEAARATGGTMVPLRLSADEVTVGPWWGPAVEAGCPACAESRRRTVLDHVLTADLEVPALAAGTPPATLLVLAREVVAAQGALAAGEVLHVSVDGVSRHRILRVPACTWCAPDPGDGPAALTLVDAPVSAADDTRVALPSPVLDQSRLDDLVVDSRYGPVRGILREERMPFAMSMAVLAGAPVMGHGRSLTYAQTRSVAVLEAYERLAGFPYEAPLVLDRSYAALGAVAVDPLTLGRYTEEQLAHESSKVERFTPELPLDWAWGTDLATGEPRLVPAEIGFYQYDHFFKHDIRASRAGDPRSRRRLFLESSSGCALGSSLAEAAIHALFEVAERDAFQLAWHRARPLPRIDAATLADPVIQQLVSLVGARGYDVHLLVATADIEVPVVWVLAVSRDGVFPATFTSAGSGSNPVDAVRSGLREVAQLVTMPIDWTAEDATGLIRDPWRVRELEDHVRWSSAPEALDRVTAVLGGPRVTLREAFPGWPGALQQEGRGIVGVLDALRARFARAGLEEIVLVDQSTREHHDLGLHVAKAVVPGTIPMVFGQAHQRLAGIPRLEAALGADLRPAHLLDPHPFP